MSKVQSKYTSIRKIEITTQSFFLYSFISVTAVPLALFNSLSWSNFYIFLSMGITVTALMGIMIYVANISLAPITKNLNSRQYLIYVLLLITISGVIRGYLVYFSIDLSGYEQPTELPIRLITSTATTVFWLSLFSIFVQDSRRYRIRYEEIIRGSVLRIAKENPLSSKVAFPKSLAKELAEIDISLRKTFDDAITSTLNRDTLLMAAYKVRATVNERIRPLSHRLWFEGLESAPKLKIWGTVVDGIRTLEIKALPISLFVALTSAFNLTTDYGIIRGVIGAVTVFIVNYLSFTAIGNYVINKPERNLIRNLLLLLLPGVILGMVLFVMNEYIFKNDLGPPSFIFILINFLVAVTSSTRELTKSDREGLLEQLKSDLITQKNNLFELSKPVEVDVASYLHNSLQSELLALSYQLEESANNPGSDRSRMLLEQLGARINRSISSDFEDFVENPFARLERVQSAWKGIAEVKITSTEISTLEPSQALLIVQIIEEAISNAVRYSKATEIEISIKINRSNEMELEITNDGLNESKAKRGLGTEWLDRYAAGKWSRELVNGKTRLKVTL